MEMLCGWCCWCCWMLVLNTATGCHWSSLCASASTYPGICDIFVLLELFLITALISLTVTSSSNRIAVWMKGTHLQTCTAQHPLELSYSFAAAMNGFRQMLTS